MEPSVKQLIFSKCSPERLFAQVDPTQPSEKEFEEVVLATLNCLYPNYVCYQFSGTFRYLERGWRPDIAMISKDFGHWFVIEVELVSHSLASHVLPQVTAFKLGEYEPDCISQLVNRTGQSEATVRSFLGTSPRHVAVIANKYLPEWEISLKALQIQMATVALYENTNGEQAYEMSGSLIPQEEHLGVGRYSAIDRSIIATSKIRIATGRRWILDLDGHEAEWTVQDQNERLWITKRKGVPNIIDGSSLQIMRTSNGSLRLRAI